MIGYKVYGCVYLEVLLLQNEICKANLHPVVRKKYIYLSIPNCKTNSIYKDIFIYKDFKIKKRMKHKTLDYSFAG